MEKIAHFGTAKPPIHISETDYALIASQAMRLEATAPQVAEMLLDEIDRAQVHSRDELPGDVATLGSVVTFVDESTGVRRCVQIVLPADADIERGSLSIVSQVGAGLIGLSAGQSIDWPCPDGRPADSPHRRRRAKSGAGRRPSAARSSARACAGLGVTGTVPRRIEVVHLKIGAERTRRTAVALIHRGAKRWPASDPAGTSPKSPSSNGVNW